MLKSLVDLYPHQQKAITELKTGSILCGGVGSGKSLTAIGYYFQEVCKCMQEPKDLYIITTARKRDSLEWEQECLKFRISTEREFSMGNVKVKVDSWNNIEKYEHIKNAFFIFDEQKVVGYGKWAKTFIKITKSNDWIFLSATPGDTWMDYLPIFIANGFFKTKGEFIYNHVIPSRSTRYFKVDRYINTGILQKYKNQILVDMPFERSTVRNVVVLKAECNKAEIKEIMKTRWNPFTNLPMRDINEMCFAIRQLTNTDSHRLILLREVLEEHDRVIVFYNFNYELEMLRDFATDIGINAYEWNGHKHEAIPMESRWLYFVQYSAGAEAWNCIETNVIFYYSLSYSYKVMEQTAGRIDRMNTPYVDLYYYVVVSDSIMDKSIIKKLKNKKSFNEKDFAKRCGFYDEFKEENKEIDPFLEKYAN